MVIKSPQDRTDFLSLTSGELAAALAELGITGYRVAQLQKRRESYCSQAGEAGLAQGSFSLFTDLPKSMREELQKSFSLPTIKIVGKQESAVDGTVKYLFELADGSRIESVFMRYEHGNSLCISTQVGCRMGCAFCASGLDGLLRGLAPSEMLLEIAAAEAERGERVDSVVMMGTGEPLDNYDASVEFIRLTGIGARHISLSTSGLVDKIKKLAGEKLQITLSVSLHSAIDETRQRLMPVAKRWSVAETVAAATEYQQATGRRVYYEYSMIRGVNDSPRDAEALAALIKGRGANVNLIRLNEIAESPYHPSTESAVASFRQKLEQSGINVTVRRRLGSDIDGACGQLRRKYGAGGGNI